MGFSVRGAIRFVALLKMIFETLGFQDDFNITKEKTQKRVDMRREKKKIKSGL